MTHLSQTSEQFKNMLNTDDKALAMLALWADLDQPQPVSSCPKLETLADYIDRRLPVAQWQQISWHLENCPECAFHYQEVYALIPWYQKMGSHAIWVRFDNFSKVVKSVLMRIISPTLHYCQKIFNYVPEIEKGFRQPPRFIMAVVAMSLMVLATVMVVKIILFTPNLTLTIDKSYAALLTQPLTPQQQKQQKALHWGRTNLGFSEVEVSPARQAFQTGLWQGGQQLWQRATTDHSSPTELVTEYELGRWLNLLSVAVASATKTPPQFWAQQYLVGDQVISVLRNTVPSEWQANALTSVQRLLPLLQQLQQAPSQALGYQLSDQLRAMIMQLS